MRRAVFAFGIVLSASALASGFATAAASPNAGAAPMQGTRVFDAFHGEPGLQRIVHDARLRYASDPRIADIFRAADFDHLEPQLVNQFCYILGGGCAYTGKSMAEAHKDMGLQEADFNALVEDLQQAMDKERVPFWAQNALLAKLAPMERHVVVR